MNSTASPPGWVARCSCITSSLRCPLTKSTSGIPRSRAKRRTALPNSSVIAAKGAVEATVHPSRARRKPINPSSRCSWGTYTLRYIRSMHSTSKSTCSARTSATLRGNVMDSSGRTTTAARPLTADKRHMNGAHRATVSVADRSPVFPPSHPPRLVGLGRSPVSTLPSVLSSRASLRRRVGHARPSEGSCWRGCPRILPTREQRARSRLEDCQ
jgi:hypothetical protein